MKLRTKLVLVSATVLFLASTLSGAAISSAVATSLQASSRLPSAFSACAMYSRA